MQPFLEFPPGSDAPPHGVSRRDFLRMAAAAAALAATAQCADAPGEPILPYVSAPPGIVPGTSARYATAMTIDGDAIGLLAESRDGRPIAVTGNPDHPFSLGAAGVYEQASVLQLYDPDRAREIRHGNAPESWDRLREALAPDALAKLAGARGAGLRLLLEPSSSPLIAAQLARLRERYPDSRTCYYSAVSRHSTYEGARLAFGRVLQPHADLSQADVIAAIDADLFGTMPGRLRHARQFAARRNPNGAMSRLYSASAMPTVTTVMADHHLPVRPSSLGTVTRELVRALLGLTPASPLPPEVTWWIDSLARDLALSRGRGVVLAGAAQSPEVHALVALANAIIGGDGTTVTYTPPTWIDGGASDYPLAALTDDIRAGGVHALLMIGANPVYTAPSSLAFAAAIARVPLVLHADLYENETSRHASWFMPLAHYLESWADTRAYDGTVSIVQPLVRPLFGGRTAAELLAAVAGDVAAPPYDMLRSFWNVATPTGDSEAWRDALRRGVMDGTALPIAQAAIDRERLMPLLENRAAAQSGLIEVVCPPDASVYDGRFANNPWLQELPDPITSLTWDNAAYLSPGTAARLGIDVERVIELQDGDRRIAVAACAVPGVADDTVVVSLGYGRSAAAEQVASGVGVDTAPIRSPAQQIVGVKVQPLMHAGRLGTEPWMYPLAFTQSHWRLEGRDIARAATLPQFRNEPAPDETGEPPTLYDYGLAPGPQWAMAIDLNVCTGCSACVVACQSENNVPVVGKQGVREGREMHWLRIDRYLTDEAAPRIMQPMLCQHCEHAPCEYVCPVNATVHSPDGLNEMVYNRCVGTRFCSNNCPYKVRRFNWLDYNASITPLRALAANPEVTVRERGVMEKCTFCVQRIRAHEIDVRIGVDSPLPRTACQQACPTGAIVFGSLTAPDSEVAAQHRDPRAYGVLQELGTRPRVRYLAKIVNPASSGTGEVPR